MKWLNNKKTMIGMVAIGALVIVEAILPDLLSDAAAQVVAGGILTWTGVSLRLAIRKAQVRT